MKFANTLKAKILFVCISISFIIIILSGIYFYQSAESAYMQQQTISLTTKLNTVINSIDQESSLIYRLSISLSNNKTITEFLTAETNPDDENSYTKANAYDECTQYLVNLGIYDIFSKGILTSTTHDSLINFGLIHGHDSDISIINSLSMQNASSTPYCIIENPFFYGLKDYVIPLRMPIYSYQSTHQAGELYVALSTDIVTKHFSSRDIESNGPVYMILGNRIYVYDGTLITDITEKLGGLQLTLQTQIDSSAYKTAPLPELNSQEFIYVQSSGSGWAIMQPLPAFSLNVSDNPNSVWLIFFLILASLMFLLLYLFFNQSIARPVNDIIVHLNKVADGNFSEYEISKSSGEFIMIHQEINQMSKDIKKLLDTTLENEKEKSTYEFKLLQSQINPHFLYNTLNSIRWLGEINGVEGIPEITTALASMLRSLAKINTQFVTLDTELKFIKDYTKIQYYRYGNAFSMEYLIEDEALYQAQIIKFTLQPLVENAIFHGIEPAHQHGIISIQVYSEEGDLFILVKDDGVGMTAEQMELLNQHKSTSNHSDIGVSNIHQRLVLEYGEPYGLSVDSKLSEYTVITVRIPLILEEQEETISNEKSIDC